jgi:hypothetical protein
MVTIARRTSARLPSRRWPRGRRRAGGAGAGDRMGRTAGTDGSGSGTGRMTRAAGGSSCVRPGAGHGTASGSAGGPGASARCRSQRMIMLMRPTSRKMAMRKSCSIEGYVLVGGGVGSPPGCAIDSRIAVSACTFFIR